MTDVMLSSSTLRTSFNHPAEMLEIAQLVLLRSYRHRVDELKPNDMHEFKSEFEAICDAIERLDVLEEQLKENFEPRNTPFDCAICHVVSDEVTDCKVLHPVEFLTEFRQDLFDAHVFWFPDKWSQGEQSQELSHAIAEIDKITDELMEVFDK